MFKLFKIKARKRSPRGTERKKILLTMDKQLLRDLSRVKPRSVTRQEAIRQIVEFYVYENFFK